VQFEINKKVIINKILYMKNNHINIYNNLVNLTRNKELYKDFVKQDVFSDRLVLFLLHFAFFLKVFKKEIDKKVMQEIYDYTFRQLELSIREIGYGDQTINKRMKDYLNLFYSMLDKIDKWEKLSVNERPEIIDFFLEACPDPTFLANYFEKYRLNLSNITFNSFIKGVIKQ